MTARLEVKEENERRRRRRSLAIAWSLVAIMALFFVVTLVRLGDIGIKPDGYIPLENLNGCRFRPLGGAAISRHLTKYAVERNRRKAETEHARHQKCCAKSDTPVRQPGIPVLHRHRFPNLDTRLKRPV